MAVVNSDVYTNADGLKIRFGTAQAKNALVGSPAQAGGTKKVLVDLDYSRFATFGNTTVLDELTGAAIPAGAIIVNATIYVTTAFTSGGAATLTIGTYRADGTTVIDEDGIDAAIALTAIDAVGEEVNCDGAQVNGAALANDAYISVQVGTANFTAGRAQLIIEFIVPKP